MPFTGGFSPGPERTGGGDGESNAPALRRIFESIAAARGPLYDQTDGSVVGAENMALARAVFFDLFGANERMANELNPAYATAAGMLPRWEKFLAQPPMPGDPESVRRARCAAALARFTRSNNVQPVVDVLTATLGGLFAGLTLFGPSNATTWWPAYGGGVAGPPGYPINPPCQLTAVTGNLMTVSSLTAVPTSAAGAYLTIANAAVPNNNGTFLVHSYVSPSAVVIVNNNPGPAPDNGVGGTGAAPTISWTFANPWAPFMSTISHVDVRVNPSVSPTYRNPDGTLSGVFFARVNEINPVLDLMLPADCTFDWYVYGVGHGGLGFYLDEPNDLDCEAFDV